MHRARYPPSKEGIQHISPFFFLSRRASKTGVTETFQKNKNFLNKYGILL